MQTLSVEQVLEETGWTKKWEERGRLEGKLEAARKLINRGWKVQEVAETLDLDINQVLAL
jgi:predicted transposase YdaD